MSSPTNTNGADAAATLALASALLQKTLADSENESAGVEASSEAVAQKTAQEYFLAMQLALAKAENDAVGVVSAQKSVASDQADLTDQQDRSQADVSVLNLLVADLKAATPGSDEANYYVQAIQKLIDDGTSAETLIAVDTADIASQQSTIATLQTDETTQKASANVNLTDFLAVFSALSTQSQQQVANDLSASGALDDTTAALDNLMAAGSVSGPASSQQTDLAIDDKILANARALVLGVQSAAAAFAALAATGAPTGSGRNSLTV